MVAATERAAVTGVARAIRRSVSRGGWLGAGAAVGAGLSIRTVDSRVTERGSVTWVAGRVFVSWCAWLCAGAAVGGGLSSICGLTVAVGGGLGSSICGLAVTVALSVTVSGGRGGSVGLGLCYLSVSVTNWRVMVVRVVWVSSFCDDAAADNGGCGLAVVVAVSGHSDSSGKEFLVATSEVLLEDGLLPSEGAVGVVGDPLGFELALVWKPCFADLGAVGASLSAVLVNSEIEFGTI